MSSPLAESDLLDALDPGASVVLPNPRAARTLREAYDARQRAAGLRAWNAAPALAWADWTRSLWSHLAVRGHELRLLLNPAQEHALWREIIRASTIGQTLSSPDTLAEMARSAWSLAAAHNATARVRPTATTFDSRTFARWAETFQKTCASESCLSAAELETALASHAASGSLPLHTPVLLGGFEEFTPAQARLIDSLRAGGANIQHAPIASATTILSRLTTVVTTPQDEIVFAARWIRSLFAGRTAESPPPRIAVLLPDPQQSRAEIESVFRDLLAPELQPIEADLSSAPWEFTPGTPLLSAPLIADALALLRWMHAPLPVERISTLLRSPFLASGSEHLAAARFDAQVLRRQPHLLPELDLDTLIRLVRRHTASGRGEGFRPAWLNAADKLRTSLTSPASRTHSEWAEVMRTVLRAAGWPGERKPTPAEFAAASAWDATLDLLATLDLRGTRVSFEAALTSLKQLLQTARVSPLRTHAPIQIMSPEDAEGSVFDAVLLLHATDASWPQPAHLHPLLGWALQQEIGWAGSNAARDADRALARAQSLLDRTPHLLALCAAADDSGPLRPSPLLDRLGIAFAPADSLLSEPRPVHPVAEELAPDDIALPPLPSPELRGGASVLKHQAACGFLAFAEMRLQSVDVDPCELGLGAIERGNLVHRALEQFWTETKSQSELRALTTEERLRRLDTAIDAAFCNLGEPLPGWSSAFLRLQRERLRAVLLRWLDVELQRGPFTVRQREQRSRIPIGPLHLNVRPDRIDEVQDGFVLVDYKTGHRVHPSHWDGQRPDDPQLPLYALLSEPGKLQGLLFGRVRPGSEMRWLGLTANRTILQNPRQKSEDLDLRLQEWRSILSTLAEDFAAGRAHVAPKSFALNCEHCRQRLLCRVDPAALASSADPAPQDERQEEESNG